MISQGKQLILAETAVLDRAWKDRSLESLANFKLDFSVPPTHARAQKLASYSLYFHKLTPADLPSDHLIIIDEHLLQLEWLKNIIASKQNVIPFQADEIKVKDVDFLNQSLKVITSIPTIIGIGGGTMLNIVGYIAEQLKSDVVYIPTTPMAMCDGSSGGKVRVNRIINGEFEKHYYRSFYEPNKIIVSPQFLESLTPHDISIGLAEIVKHALYQSEGLLEYLLSEEFSPLKNHDSLMKAILWTADLKRLCLEIDPDETPEGSHFILQAAHHTAEQFEVASHFKISHGEAVWKGMELDLQNNPTKRAALVQLKAKLFT